MLRAARASTLIAALFTAFALLAQPDTGIVRGRVTDARNSRPLSGALVEAILPDTLMSTTTDARGVYRLVAPIGILSLRITAEGFEQSTVPEVWVRAGKESVVDRPLEAAAILLAPGEIVRQRTAPGTNTLTVEQTLRYPAGFFDPARTATTFSGVANTNDQANHFSVRGNNPNANAWLLEGAEMVNPNHLSNAGTPSDLPTLSGGGVNILSAQMLGTSHLLKGSMNPDRGNALGGIMDMELRRGNSAKREWTAQAGLIGLDLATEGPIGRSGRSSYLVNYRYSTLGLLSSMGVDLGDEVISFQDLSLHVTLPLGGSGELRFFGLGGNSSNVFEAKSDTSAWEFDKDGSDITYTARTGAAGATMRLPAGDHGVIKATVMYSGTEQEREAIRFGNDLQAIDTSTADLRESKLSTVVHYEGGWGDRARVTLGGSAMQRDLTNLLDEHLTGWLVRPDANVRLYISHRFVVGLGLAYAHFTFNSSEALEPRASLQYTMNGSRRLTLTAGRRSQLPMHQLLNVRFNDQLPWNEKVGLTLSDEAVLAYDHPVNERLTFHVEVYHQQLSDVPELDPRYSTFVSPDNLVNAWDDPAFLVYRNTGRSTNSGLEVSVEHTFSKHYFYLANVSIYDSRYALNGKDMDTRWNGNYILNASAGKEFVKRKEDRARTWGFSGRLLVKGGARTTPIDERLSGTLGATVPGGPAWSDQFSMFQRLDLRVYLKRERTGRTGMWALDLQNALNAQNAAYRYYDVRKAGVVTKYQLGLIPNLSYRIEF